MCTGCRPVRDTCLLHGQPEGGRGPGTREGLLPASSHSTAHPGANLPRPFCPPEAESPSQPPFGEPAPKPPSIPYLKLGCSQTETFLHPPKPVPTHPRLPEGFLALVNGPLEFWDTFLFQTQVNIETHRLHCSKATTPFRSVTSQSLQVPFPPLGGSLQKPRPILSACPADPCSVPSPCTSPRAPPTCRQHWHGLLVTGQGPCHECPRNGPLCSPLSPLASFSLTPHGLAVRPSTPLVSQTEG